MSTFGWTAKSFQYQTSSKPVFVSVLVLTLILTSGIAWAIFFKFHPYVKIKAVIPFDHSVQTFVSPETGILHLAPGVAVGKQIKEGDKIGYIEYLSMTDIEIEEILAELQRMLLILGNEQFYRDRFLNQKLRLIQYKNLNALGSVQHAENAFLEFLSRQPTLSLLSQRNFQELMVKTRLALMNVFLELKGLSQKLNFVARFDGVVSRLTVSDLSQANKDQQVALLTRISTRHVLTLYIDAKHIPHIHLDDPFFLNFESGTKETSLGCTGKISEIDQVATRIKNKNYFLAKGQIELSKNLNCTGHEWNLRPGIETDILVLGGEMTGLQFVLENIFGIKKSL